MIIIDMSLSNAALYAGCAVGEAGGRPNLTTPVPDAVNLVGRNIAALVDELPPAERAEVTLTGPVLVAAHG
jgi:hypothetical protein